MTTTLTAPNAPIDQPTLNAAYLSMLGRAVDPTGENCGIM